MQITDQKLVCLTEFNRKKCQSRTQAVYGTITSAECLALGNNTDTRVIGVVYFNPATKTHVVKTANGYSNLQDWL